MLTSFTGKKLTNKDTCNTMVHSKCFKLKSICQQMTQITHYFKVKSVINLSVEI